MKLTFLGTHGEIAIRSRPHRRHSSLLVEHDNARIMIDCGADWLHRLRSLAPTAIVLTHAHDDHAAGLAKGAPCPVYATAATWKVLSYLPIIDRRTMRHEQRCRLMACGSAPFRSCIRFVLLLWDIVYLHSSAVSSICQMLPSCQTQLVRFAGSISI